MLNSVHEDDSGTYTCKLSTAKGKSQMLMRREELKEVLLGKKQKQKKHLPKQRLPPEELTSNANLRVAPSREPLFTRKLDILEVIEGRTARFDCKVSGSPAPRVTWRHFGKELQIGCVLLEFQNPEH